MESLWRIAGVINGRILCIRPRCGKNARGILHTKPIN